MTTKVGPNQPCTCGSGKKFKKCCGPRGGLTEIEYAEEQAYKDEAARERAKRPRRHPSLPAALFGLFGSMYSYPGPMPDKPRRKNRRKPQ